MVKRYLVNLHPCSELRTEVRNNETHWHVNPVIYFKKKRQPSKVRDEDTGHMFSVILMTGSQRRYSHKVVKDAVLNKGVVQACSSRLNSWSTIILPSLVDDKSKCDCLIQEEGNPEDRREVCLMRAILCVILEYAKGYP